MHILVNLCNLIVLHAFVCSTVFYHINSITNVCVEHFLEWVFIRGGKGAFHAVTCFVGLSENFGISKKLV